MGEDMSRRLFDNKAECTGCTACFATCPVKAIRMVPDEEGFLYPQIQKELCIHCGKCDRVCPQKEERSQRNAPSFYAVKHEDSTIREKSSSGGFFSLLAQYVEEKKGVIYGAAFDDEFVVRHMRAETESKWKRFRTSKYVQSDLGDTIAQVKCDLEQERMVLFTGTPCQVDGLKRALKGNKYLDWLVTCDVVCHGVPSPKVWMDWLAFIKKHKNIEIDRINFRDKEHVGWHDSTITIWDKNGEICLKEKQNEAIFSRLFFDHYIVRPSCFHCKYSNLNRPGDITIGDFWGVEKCFPEFDDNMGISLVLCNTIKGKNLFHAVRHQMATVKLEQFQCMQPALETNYQKPEGRDYFWEWYISAGLASTLQIMGYVKSNWRTRLNAYAKRMIHRLVWDRNKKKDG